MNEENLEHLFAAARRAGRGEIAPVPRGFAESVIQQHRLRSAQNRSFFRTSVLSIAAALAVLGTVAGINAEWNSSSSNEEQEATVEMAYALWDPAGN